MPDRGLLQILDSKSKTISAYPRERGSIPAAPQHSSVAPTVRAKVC